MPSHDTAQRRRAQRRGREAGCWVYVTAEALQKAGWAAGEPPPFYRTWGSTRGTAVVRFYKEP